MTPESAAQVLNDVIKKLEKLSKSIPGDLSELWDDICTMITILRDYLNGDYRDVSWRVIAAVAAALAYLALPFDVIPDCLIGPGYVDDGIVIRFCAKQVRVELDKYRENKSACPNQG